MTVYTGWLGEGFDDLPQECQDLHAGYGRFAGRITVSYARLPFLAQIGQKFGFARPTDNGDLIFEARQEGGQDHWLRFVDGVAMKSTLWVTEDGVLAEKLGPVTVTMVPNMRGRVLELRMAGFQIGALTLPSWLRPQVEASEFAEAQRYRFEVTIRLPFLGTQIVHYSGWIDSCEALPE